MGLEGHVAISTTMSKYAPIRCKKLLTPLWTPSLVYRGRMLASFDLSLRDARRCGKGDENNSRKRLAQCEPPHYSKTAR
jgi:hypothetical protein